MIEEDVEWAPIPGFEGFYDISDTGDVRSHTRIIANGFRLEGKTLSPATHPRGSYQHITLYRDGKPTYRTIHSLVAEVFIGPKPDGHRIYHLDGDNTNNHAWNLKYATRPQYHESNTMPSYCKNGHEYTPSNTIIRTDNGSRRCRTCTYASQRRTRRNRK